MSVKSGNRDEDEDDERTATSASPFVLSFIFPPPSAAGRSERMKDHKVKKIARRAPTNHCSSGDAHKQAIAAAVKQQQQQQ